MNGKLDRRCPLQGAHLVRVCRGAVHQAVQPLALAWLEQACLHKRPAECITPGCGFRKCLFIVQCPVQDIT